MSSQRKPDFVCIGYPKTGTTWLSTALKNHPEIYVHPAKEVNYFWGQITSKRWYSPLLYNAVGRSLVNYNRRWKRKTLKTWLKGLTNESKPWIRKRNWKMLSYFSPLQNQYWYNHQFDSTRISGDITPGYIHRYKEREIRLLYDNNPETKILCRLRNPVEQAWSMTKMIKMKRPTRDFKFHLRKSIEKSLRFDEKIDLWLSVFPQNQFHLSFYEDFKEDKVNHLNSILDFLGASHPKSRIFWDPLQSEINKGHADYIFPEEMKIAAAKEILPKLKSLKRYVPEYIMNQWIDRTETISKSAIVKVESN